LQGTSFKYCYNYTRLSGVTFGLTNTSVFPPINRTELYTSANMSIAMVNNVDREMIFTATEASVRFYITRGWAPGLPTPTVEEVSLDYLNIAEIPSQVNTISCVEIQEALARMTYSGQSTTDQTLVKNYLNKTFNRNHTYSEYATVIAQCSSTTQPVNYVLAKEGAEAASVEAGYAYGFGGQMMDNEISGDGNAYTAEYWEYDSRLGRRWNVDPVTYAWQSSYAVFNNCPIVFIDPTGLEAEGNGEPKKKDSDVITAPTLKTATVTAERPSLLKSLWSNFKNTVTSKQYREYKREREKTQREERLAEDLKTRGEYRSYGFTDAQNRAAAKFYGSVAVGIMTGGVLQHIH
jgi:hypothetical protein